MPLQPNSCYPKNPVGANCGFCALRARSSLAFWLMHWGIRSDPCADYPTFSAFSQWPACAADKTLLHLQHRGGAPDFNRIS